MKEIKLSEIFERLRLEGKDVSAKKLLEIFKRAGMPVQKLDDAVPHKLGVVIIKRYFKVDITKPAPEKPVPLPPKPAAPAAPQPEAKEASQPEKPVATQAKPAPKKAAPTPKTPPTRADRGEQSPRQQVKREKTTKELEEELIKEIEAKSFYEDKYQDLEQESRVHTRLKNIKKARKRGDSRRKSNVQKLADRDKVMLYYEGMTVAMIADGLNLAIGDLVRKLISMGYMVSASQLIDRDTVEILAIEYGYELKDAAEVDITRFEQLDVVDSEQDLVERPAIVTIMGHVDHGKTTLLDTIRHTKVTAGEAGGITQHIGAYQVEKDGKKITFIDTPGHAAFTEMRSRGAQITDIVVLVVAADDGVMPQTVEAIEHARAAKVPIIVAVNKMDKPQANPERVKQELANIGLMPEEWGGDSIYVPISALKGTGIEELLENILLIAEMQELKANPNRLAMGSVIEAKIDRGKGVVATLLVKNGSMKVGDPIVVGTTYGKIRTMTDETKRLLKVSLPSKAVEVTGLNEVPQAGDHFMVFEDEKTARLVAEDRKKRAFEKEKGVGTGASLAGAFEAGASKELKVIIKADVDGSVEALKNSLLNLQVEDVKIEIIRAGVGSVIETDVTLATVSEAIIIGFNIRPKQAILDYAKEQGVEIRLYTIIYKLLEDIEDAMKGMLEPIYEEKVIGEAEVRQIFHASKIGTIAGSYVTNGVIRRQAHVRLVRDSIIIYDGNIAGLRRFDDDVKEVKTGFECGITLENFNDIKNGDLIEAYVLEEVAR